ncbi:predicted protein [Postia placenta Mad-698-R]|nr:predicted protein [Postia placenta Mad-698-R]
MPAKMLGRTKTQAKKESGRGLFSRKNAPKADDSPSDSPEEKASLSPAQSRTSSGKDKERASDDNTQLFGLLANSLIPDPLPELPAWFHTDSDAWSASSPASIRSRYPMHNTAGPRWYRNHHLFPPQDNTPPSQFSPSFPPMPSAAERSQESTRVPGLSRTPSESPSPTPNSSQIRIMEPNGRVRTRKISQSENADLLDNSDPWGMQWHHESPYDIGLNQERGASPDAESPTEPRARRMSFNASTSRHKTVTPSPLSQSTSAIHLSVSDPTSAHIPRRLSKRRKPFVGIFGHQSQDNFHAHPKAASAPPDGTSFTDDVQQKMLRRKSTGPPIAASASMASLHPDSSVREKHSSFMGRLARRFSVMRKQDPVAIKVDSPTDSAPAEARKSIVNGTKRVPAPSIDGEGELRPRASTSISFEGAPAPGRLTIANPDEGMSLTESPAAVEAALPPVEAPQSEVHASALQESSPTPETPIAPTLSADMPAPAPPMSPLPPPTVLANFDHSLPPTPTTTARPLSTSTDAPSQSANTTSYAASVSGLTSGFTNYDPSSTSLIPDDAALARASMVANPPTPHLTPLVIFPSQSNSSAFVVQPTAQESSKHRDGSPTKAKESSHRKSPSTTRRRETETFKLVRSPSGSVRSPNGDVITGMGEQWEVVESADSPKRSRKKESSKSKERDGEEVAEPRAHRRQRSTNEPPAVDRTPSAARSTRTPSVDTARRRPTSDFQNSAELNAMRAKDAWEMDRLWKARSMAIGPDGAAVVQTPPTIVDGSVVSDGQTAGSIPSALDLHRATSAPQPTQHGSNHTFYAIQPAAVPPPPAGLPFVLRPHSVPYQRPQFRPSFSHA